MEDPKVLLKSYRPLVRFAEKCFRELDAARAVSVRSPRMDGMPRTGGINGLEMQVAQIERVRERAEQARERAFERLEEIEDMIDSLEDPEQMMVLKMHYVYGYTWAETAIESGMAERTVYNVHGRALTELRRKNVIKD